jgi:NADH-quinone oxidoreductase subunit J
MTVIFYISAIVAVFSTVMVITRYNAIHALLYLVVSLLAVSVIFYSLGAPFIAALEVIIYAGAIMVLFIFVVMMLNLGKNAEDQERKLLSGGMWFGPGLLSLIMLVEFIYIFSAANEQVAGRVVGPKAVGISLFGKYLLGVELAAVLLLAGIVGAYHLGRREKKFIHRFLEKDSQE